MRPFVAAFCSILLAVPTIAQDPPDAKKLKVAADAAVQQKDWVAAVASFRKLTELDPKDGKAWHMLGYCLHADGKLDEALPIHVKATAFPEVAPTAAYNAACVHALKGDQEQAFAWLDKAIGFGFTGVEYLANDTDLDSLRQDARFPKVVEKAKAKSAPATAVKAYTPVTERRSARVAFFSQSGSPGQLAIDFTPIAWKDSYDAAIDDAKMVGRKWRLGGDFWTTLDTSLDLQIGGVAVPAGYYYLTATSLGGGKFVLGVHDAAAVRKLKLDAYVAHMLQDGIEVPLAHAAAAKPADKLAIAIELQDGKLGQGTLRIRFGGHELTAPVAIKL